MMQQIGTPDNVGEAIAQCKADEYRIMGVGHRVYKTKDPRCERVKDILRKLKEKGREDPLVAVAVEIERQVAADKFFAEHRLCVNIDLYLPLVLRLCKSSCPKPIFGKLRLAC